VTEESQEMIDFRDLLDQLPDGIGVYRDGKFLHVNRSLLETLGYEGPGEVVGKPWTIIVHPDHAERMDEMFQKVLRDGGISPFAEVECLRKDGGTVTVELAAVRVNFDGQPAVVGIGRDVSERKELTARMMKMDRMITIGTLAAGVGHEINNPLTVVIENVRFAIERLEQMRNVVGVGEVLESLEEARQGARRVGLVTRDLKTFSHTDETGRETILIEDLVDSATSLVWNELRHRAKLVKDMEPGLHVSANRALLGQVFLNLLLNAAHAIEEGRADHNSIRIRSWQRDDHVLVEFTDTGTGIPPVVRDRIFEPFYTTKPIGQGTGLGLSICREIVEAHGGEVLLQSEMERGSTFTVVLPLAEAAEQADAEPQPVDEVDEALGKARILVVDDEPMICSLVSRALGKEHEVVALTEAHRAVELFKGGDRFDIIFCDLMMPDMTGMDLHAAVEQISPAQADRIVFLTGGAFTPRAREFLDSVDNRRMDKPFDVRALKRLVEAMLD
jgi:PAS domain S-box-containing protein